MADKRSVGHAYNIDFLNVVFAASSLLLFFSTVWMVWDDYDREWKDYQRRFVQLETEVTQARFCRGQWASRPNTGPAACRPSVAEAEQELASNQEQVDALEGQAGGSWRLGCSWQTRSTSSPKPSTMPSGTSSRKCRKRIRSSAAERRPEIDEMFEHWLELGLEVERLTAERDGVRAQVRTFTGRVEEIDVQLREITAETDRLTSRLVDLAPSLVDDLVLNAPLLDFMAPTITVRQVITPEIVDDVNFTRVAKMDRCTTCHLAIDREGYEEYPQPFSTHPNLEAYVGSASPHPVGEVWLHCLPRRDGAVDNLSEMPRTPPMERRRPLSGKRPTSWEEPHLWDFPMLPTDMTEASCTKCHRGSVFVPEGPDLSLAYGLYERAGCYACHKTVGFEDLRKPGPSLTRVGAKLTREWVSRWIRDPRAVKVSTWMPRVWYNSNTRYPRGRAAERSRDRRGRCVSLRQFGGTCVRRVVSPPAGNADTRAGGRRVRWGAWRVTSRSNQDRLEAGPRRTFGQPLAERREQDDL